MHTSLKVKTWSNMPNMHAAVQTHSVTYSSCMTAAVHTANWHKQQSDPPIYNRCPYIALPLSTKCKLWPESSAGSPGSLNNMGWQSACCQAAQLCSVVKQPTFSCRLQTLATVMLQGGPVLICRTSAEFTQWNGTMNEPWIFQQQHPPLLSLSLFLSVLTSVSISEVFTVILHDLNSKNKNKKQICIHNVDALFKFKLLHTKQLIHIQIQISCVSEYKCYYYKEAPVNQ